MLATVGAVALLRHPKLARGIRRQIGGVPRIGRPRRYLELMLWRKVIDRNPLFVVCSDKLATKAYAAARCPDLDLPPTLWSGTDLAGVPDELLEADAYLKASHGFGWNVRLGPGADRAALHREAGRWLRSTHGRNLHEWAYSQVPPCLLIEAAIGDADGDLLEIEVRAGAGRAIHGSIVGHNKRPGEWTVFLDRDGSALTSDDEPLLAAVPTACLDAYRAAVRHVEVLSRELDYARFDFFWNGHTLYGGEIVIYPAGGEWELPSPRSAMIAGAWDLRTSHVLTHPQRGWRRWYAEALRRRLAGEPAGGAARPTP